ncbi:MAG: THUMP domain-containing protein [Candidatus Woesearchaeota archaeon]
MFDSIIIRYGEIGIKGKNRYLFEKQLLDNIRDTLLYNKVEFRKIYRSQSRIIINFEKYEELLKAINSLKSVFGIKSFSPASKTNLDLNEIKDRALDIYDLKYKENNKIKKPSFRITTQRINKKFILNSQEINQEVGAFIVENRNAKVDLENPEINIGIEILDKAYLFLDKIYGLGGLPVSNNDFFVIELENEDSLIASLLMMKRGLRPIFVLNNKNKIFLLKKIEPFYPKIKYEIIREDSKYYKNLKILINSNRAVFISSVRKLNKKSIEKLEIMKKGFGFVLAPLILLDENRIKNLKELLKVKK